MISVELVHALNERLDQVGGLRGGRATDWRASISAPYQRV